MRGDSSTLALSFTALVTCFLVESSAQPQAAAEASDDQIVAVLAPELGAASVLTMQDLTDEQIDNIGTETGLGWRFNGDFNSDGQPDLALLGSYRRAEGRGSFVLFASRQATAWRRSGLVQFPRPLIIGRAYNDALFVWFCTGCDSGGRIVWTSAGYEFVPFPPPGVPE